MSWFRKKSADVIRKGVGSDTVIEERTQKRVDGQLVEVRHVRETPPTPPAQTEKRPSRERRSERSVPNGRRPRPVEEEIILPPDTARKQMLVRVMPHQTQIVVLEGPSLVEHYVARSDVASLVGNVYLGRVRNVLPGMEAAFIDFGAQKNGVVYSDDISYDRSVHGRKRPRIEEVVHEGDEILVQVVKDAMGAKGARLTNQLSLPGRFLVLVPDSDANGISRRLSDDERTRLRVLVDDFKPTDMGVIVRTAAEGATREDIEEDVTRLVGIWDRIRAEAANGGAPRLLYQEPELLIRVIREQFTPDFRRLLIDQPAAHEAVVRYLQETSPELLPKLQRYQDPMPLFERFHVEDQLRKALDRRVYLPSGGHLVIDRTEALTVIDVNTGKFVGSSSLEETVLHNNLEAAEEIGRQLRLRDIGGIIVIDFIDMENEANRRAVLRRLRETLAKDRTRTQVFDVSNLGLVEMTRKNVSAGLLEVFSEPCPTCEGRGVLLHEDAAVQGIPVAAILEED